MRALLVAVLFLVPAAPVFGAAEPPYSRAGGYLTDATGRVFISHGVNMVYKVTPYAPSASGFGEDDADFLAKEGFNTIRLGLIYKAVEPQPGVYDDAYIADVAATAALLEKHGIAPLIDFHQDLYNEKYQGEGWPDWAVIDNGAPNVPQAGFPNNYLTNTALNRAFDNFWANAPGPGDVGLGDRFAAAWKRVAARFAGSDVLGYDLLNEPWPGSGWQQCANTAGCPEFDQGRFADFYRRTMAAIRQSDPTHLTFYEPAVTYNFGGGTSLPKFDTPSAMSFHVYCLAPTTGPSGGACEQSERIPFQNADARTKSIGDPTMITEFGATEDLADIKRVVDLADQFKIGWQYWHYCACSDPTTQGPGETQAIVKDPAKPPAGDNLKQAKLNTLVRPYPQLIAGTPKSWSFDADTKTFVLDFTTARAGGGRFSGRPATEVYVPPRQYPDGYVVQVENGTVASGRDAAVLLVRPCAGAKEVKVSVRKPGSGPNSVACPAGGVAGVKVSKQSLVLTVKPRKVLAGAKTTFRFRVRSGRFAVSGARVRFAGHDVKTGKAGTAKLRLTLRRKGARRAAAYRRGFSHGTTKIRVARQGGV